MNAGFWQGKRVLVTGHRGFKGSWLSAWLQLNGASVVGYSLPSPVSRSNLFENGPIESVEGDIRDLESLKNTIKTKAPEIVIHTAAQALVKTGYADPVNTYATNVMGTVNLLEAVRRSDNVRVVIAVSSDKCYEYRETKSGHREDDPIGGSDPYSSSKGCAELVINAYRKSYFENDDVLVASVRAGNVIGGGDWGRDRLVPDIIKGILANQAIQIRRPRAVRPWQFVLDPLRGYLELAERLWNGERAFVGAWNFGPDADDVKPVEWIANRITERWGDGARWTLDQMQHPAEDDWLILDSTKAKVLLGWRPLIRLPTAIDWVIDWYRAFADKRDLRAVTENQIREYESLLID